MPRRKSYFDRCVTFLWVPHDAGRPLQVRMSLPFFHFLLLLFFGLLAWGGWFVSRDLEYRNALLQKKRLKESFREVLTELESHRALIERVAKLDSQLREMLELKNPKRIVEAGGVGGPTEEDSNRLSRALQRHNDELLAKVAVQLRDVQEKAEAREESFREIQAFLDRQRSILAATPSIWPVKGWVTSGYGNRASPLTGEPGRHFGVDIANEPNTPIRATADGIVTYAGWQSGYGRVIVVEHGYGYSTRYGHCARVRVKVGYEVRRGDVVGYVGSTGRSTGSHVHYEVRLHGVPVDPEKYLPALN